MFVILGTVEGPTASLCGNMTGFATTFAVKELSDVTLSLVAQGRHKFSITATQFACAAVPPFVSPSSAGLRIRDPPKYVPVSTTTPAPHVRVTLPFLFNPIPPYK
ncbi:uncharacterized protein LOC108679159 [Hyalella azteca]|uniref:Uncharacterized protein LOC108679159 n=1 Tax=Hyalella azteca TaxID=294128 RepID=A0A8B7PAP4_HYAAZ|nr:uncharacterized protein LOC108679159 [Hyalella azteca]